MKDTKDVMLKLEEYTKRFNDMFPTMNFMNASNDDYIKMIDECLAKNQKAKVVFNLDYSNDIKY